MPEWPTMTRNRLYAGAVIAAASMLFLWVVAQAIRTVSPRDATRSSQASDRAGVEREMDRSHPIQGDAANAKSDGTASPDKAAELRSQLYDLAAKAKAKGISFPVRTDIDRFVDLIARAEACDVLDDSSIEDLWREVDRQTILAAAENVSVDALDAELAAWEMGLTQAMKGAECPM